MTIGKPWPHDPICGPERIEMRGFDRRLKEPGNTHLPLATELLAAAIDRLAGAPSAADVVEVLCSTAWRC